MRWVGLVEWNDEWRWPRNAPQRVLRKVDFVGSANRYTGTTDIAILIITKAFPEVTDVAMYDIRGCWQCDSSVWPEVLRIRVDTSTITRKM